MRKLGIRICAISIAVLLWYGVALFVRVIKGVTFPMPHDTIQRLQILLSGVDLYNQTIFSHLTQSLMRWSIGYFIAVILGLQLGLLLGSSRLLHDLFMPTVYSLQLIPGLAWIPIALLIFGIGSASTIFMIFMLGIIPIIINTAGGIKSIPPIYLKVARTLGTRKAAIFFKVMLPAAALPIVNGLRIGLAGAWRVLIAAEMIVGAGVGLGYIIIQSRWSLDFEAAFVSIFIICFIGLAIEKGVFRVIEKRIMKRTGLSEAKL